VHPSYLLRLPDSQQKDAEMQNFRKEIEFIRLFE